MSNIRLTYSGLVYLVIKIASLGTGLIFTIFVTRSLAISDFGVYSLIGSLIAYSMFGFAISGYWITRHIARGEDAGRSSIVINGIFSLIGTIAYLVTAYFIAQSTNFDFRILVIGATLVPVTYIANTLDAINQGFKPQNVSYSFLSFEIAKIPIGFLLLEGVKFGLLGAILATLFANLVKIIMSTILAWPQLRGIIKLIYFKKWLKLSWLSLYDVLSSNIYVLDTVIIALILNTTQPLGYFAAATTIATVSTFASGLATALGPKLLSDAKPEYVKSTMRLFSLFGIPLFVYVIVFAKSMLFLLNPAYATAVIVVYLLTIRSFFYSIYTVFAGILSGIERTDANENSHFSDYRKSHLFLLANLHYLRCGLYIGSLIIFLLLSKIYDLSIINIVIVWALIALIAEIPNMVYAVVKVYRVGFMSFDWKPIVKYAVFSVISGMVSVYLIENIVIFKRDLLVFLPGMILSLMGGLTIYFITVYVFDNYFRSLLYSIIRRS